MDFCKETLMKGINLEMQKVILLDPLEKETYPSHKQSFKF